MIIRHEAEQFAKIVIPLYGVKLITQILNASVLANLVGSIGGPESPAWMTNTSQILSIIGVLIVPIGVSIWLYIKAQSHGYSKWVWSLFGLVGGLLSAAIFCLVRVAEVTTVSNRSKPLT